MRDVLEWAKGVQTQRPKGDRSGLGAQTVCPCLRAKSRRAPER